jgi:hypothetical protein
MTPRQITAFLHFAGQRRRRHLAELLSVQATAASGDGNAINKEMHRLTED